MNHIDLIARLDNDAQFLSSPETQSALREFVTNKSSSIEERFKVWKDHCKKEEGGWVLHEGEFGIIGSLVENLYPCEYDRYREYDFEFFLELIEEVNEDEYQQEQWQKNISDKWPTVDEFKESLIETNFGSFIYDW